MFLLLLFVNLIQVRSKPVADFFSGRFGSEASLVMDWVYHIIILINHSSFFFLFFSVVEAFFLNNDDQYLEVELAP